MKSLVESEDFFNSLPANLRGQISEFLNVRRGVDTPADGSRHPRIVLRHEEIGKRLIEWRKKQRNKEGEIPTQEEIAFHLGVHRTAVAKWESGDNPISTENLIGLAQYRSGQHEGLFLAWTIFGEEFSSTKLDENGLVVMTPPPRSGRDPLKQIAEQVVHNYVQPPIPSYPYQQIKPLLSLQCTFAGASKPESLIPRLHQHTAANTSGRAALVLGEYGQGKTVACGVFAYELASQFKDSRQSLVPVILPLRDLPDPNNIADYALKTLRNLHDCDDLTQEEYYQAQFSGKLFFILDGLDEFIARSKEKNPVYHLEQFAQSATLRRNRYLVTSRPNVFRGEEIVEIRQRFGLDVIRIESLTVEAARTYLKEHNVGHLLHSPQGDMTKLLPDLVRRPLFLEMIAAAVSELPKDETLRNLTEVSLYEKYLKKWYRREVEKIGGGPDVLREDAIDRILSYIAYEMCQANTDSISEDKLDAAVQMEVKALTQQGVLVLLDSLRAMQSQAQERLVLVPVFTSDGRCFTFGHDSLRSYFLARYFYRLLRSEAPSAFETVRLDEVSLTFLLGLVQRDPVARNTLATLYEQDVNEAHYRHNTLGTVLLLWALRGGAPLDVTYFQHFCERADSDTRRLLVTNLENIDFSNLDLSHVNLQEAVLRESKFTNLEGADLSRANLNGANLEGCCLSRTTLNGTSLKRAILKGAELCDVHGKDTNFDEADLTKTTIHNSIFEESDFNSTILTSANISDSVFTNCKFRSVSLRFTNLSRCEWNDCDMRGVEWHGAEEQISTRQEDRHRPHSG